MLTQIIYFPYLNQHDFSTLDLCTEYIKRRDLFSVEAVEKPAETQTSIRLASHFLFLESLTSDLDDVRSNSLCGWNSVI